MTSRERVLTALRREAPDRTPFFEKLVKSPVADDILGRPHAAANFTHRMERLADGDWRGLMLQEARDTVDIAKILGFDMIRLYPNELPPAEPPVRIDEANWRIGSSLVERLPSGWIRHRPSRSDGAPAPSKPSAEEAARVALDADYAAPAFNDDSFLMWREACRIIADEDLHLAIFAAAYTIGAAAVPPHIFEWFVRDRETLARYYERQGWLGRDLGLRYIEEGADLIALGGDIACDHGPMVSPADYRELMMPAVREQSRAMRAAGAFT
ncbi:MAG TPA: hypothetical protein QGH10_19080, partial [Armatimonadota bacterium]|nr:hypothetical protein [Armatimonadota bacterium]